MPPTTSHPWRLSRPAFLLVVLCVLAGCGGTDVEITPATVDGDRLLFERGQQALEQEDWLDAREFFSRVRDNYPQSPLRAEARLGVADSFEGQGTSEAYVAALAEYQDFLALYPTHPRAPYAQFKIGMVHHRQMRAPERDQSETMFAIREFEAFIERYPNSDLMPDVRRQLREARDRLSESEFFVGRYYYRRKWWPGAIDRLRAVITTDPDYANREEVYFHLADALYQSGEMEEARSWFDRLLTEFPQTVHLEDASAAVADIEAQLAAAPAPETDVSQTDDDADP